MSVPQRYEHELQPIPRAAAVHSGRTAACLSADMEIEVVLSFQLDVPNNNSELAATGKIADTCYRKYDTTTC